MIKYLEYMMDGQSSLMDCYIFHNHVDNELSFVELRWKDGVVNLISDKIRDAIENEKSCNFTIYSFELGLDDPIFYINSNALTEHVVREDSDDV